MYWLTVADPGFSLGMRNRRSGGRKSPSGVQGRSPAGEGLGAKPPEARDIISQLITGENFNIKK